ncbi:MAG: secondary thiamine-phosphate synthase enzyme YjbQ [Dehalococcoidia bacterium]|nr:secondary thiamine-phosphate synthase enzyme YjbQ [Dehalococcoidia bacterium]
MIATSRVRLQTEGNIDIVDITPGVKTAIEQSGIRNGIVVIFVAGSTAAITTLEFEPGLIVDLREAMERWAPRGLPYRHHLTWGDDNGHSHVRASFLGPSLAVPLIDGTLSLGVWQQIALVDLDTRPRVREIIVQIVGE